MKILVKQLFIFILLTIANQAHASVSCRIPNLSDFQKFDKPMEFCIGSSGGNNSYSTWISAVGVIENDTPDKFLKFLKDNEPSTTNILFHSPGGSLHGGVLLGEIIRDYELSTYIGLTNAKAEHYYHNGVEEGVCLSSCAYAFLGGVRRNLDFGNHDDNKLGFHQFYYSVEDIDKLYSPEELNKNVDEIQRTLGLLLIYFDRMGVDPRLLMFSSLTSSDDMVFLDKSSLIDMNVISGPYMSPIEIEVVDGGILAVAKKNNSISLINSVVFGCYASTGIRTLILQVDNIINWKDPDLFKRIDIRFDNKNFWISHSNTKIVSDVNYSYVIIEPITDDFMEHVFNTSNIEINIDTANVHGYTVVDIEIVQNYADMINLSMKNCAL